MGRMALPRPRHRSNGWPRLRIRRSVWSLLLIGALLSAALAPVPAQAKPNPAAWKANPVASGQAGQQACADFLFVGVRGSGEPDGYGDTVTGVRDGLAERWTHGTVRQVWLDYPAADPHTLTQVPMESLLFDDPMPKTEYFGSADTGAVALGAVLADSMKRCPAERTIMAGFSQGAQVITQALTTMPDAVNRLGAAILLGNPFHYPSQSIRELSGSASANAIGLGSLLYLLRHQAHEGDATSREQGVKNLLTALIALHEGTLTDAQVRRAVEGTGAEIPPGAYAHTYSACQAGDLVCDAGPAMTDVLLQNSTMDAEFTRTRPIHLGYSPTLLKGTLDQVSSDIAALPPLVVPVSPSASPQPPALPSNSSGVPTGLWLLGVGALAAIGVGYGVGRWHSASTTRRRNLRSASSAGTASSPASGMAEADTASDRDHPA